MDEKGRTKKLVRAFAHSNKEKRPSSIAQLEEMIRIIFSGPIFQMSVEEISFHFIEEVGEVSESLADITKSAVASKTPLAEDQFKREWGDKVFNIAEELADVFSWAVTFIAKIQTQLDSFEDYLSARFEPTEMKKIRKTLGGAKKLNLSDIIWQKYGLEFGELRCATCNERPCLCATEKERPLYGESLTDDLRESIYRVISGLK